MPSNYDSSIVDARVAWLGESDACLLLCVRFRRRSIAGGCGTGCGVYMHVEYAVKTVCQQLFGKRLISWINQCEHNHSLLRPSLLHQTTSPQTFSQSHRPWRIITSVIPTVGQLREQVLSRPHTGSAFPATSRGHLIFAGKSLIHKCDSHDPRLTSTHQSHQHHATSPSRYPTRHHFPIRQVAIHHTSYTRIHINNKWIPSATLASKTQKFIPFSQSKIAIRTQPPQAQ